MATASDDSRKFDISAVLSRAFEAITENILVFAGLALVLTGPPAFVMQWWQMSHVRPEADPQVVLTPAYWGPFLIAIFVNLITSAILQAALTRATVTHLSGEKPGLVDCLVTGLSLIIPMIVIGILMGFALVFGFLLLIVPGVILMLMWAVVIPVYVQERPGIFESFSRSADLTQGARWKVLALWLVVWVALMIFGTFSGIIVVMSAASGGLLLPALVQAVVTALGAMFSVAVTASIYVELRDVKDGVAPDELETIFA